MRSPIRVFAAAAFIVALAGCSSVDDRTGARVFTGAAAGAAGGAVIGVLTGGVIGGTLIGAAAGAASGAVVDQIEKAD